MGGGSGPDCRLIASDGVAGNTFDCYFGAEIYECKNGEVHVVFDYHCYGSRKTIITIKGKVEKVEEAA